MKIRKRTNEELTFGSCDTRPISRRRTEGESAIIGRPRNEMVPGARADAPTVAISTSPASAVAAPP